MADKIDSLDVLHRMVSTDSATLVTHHLDVADEPVVQAPVVEEDGVEGELVDEDVQYVVGVLEVVNLAEEVGVDVGSVEV